MAFDLVIRGGMVTDGTGGPSYPADVAVDDGVIVEIGNISDRGREEVDADGLCVTPGFIDVHTHLDAQVNWDPLGPSAWHGITTAVMGNCGFSLAPCRPEDREMVFKIFERSEDLPRDSLMTIDWRWDSFASWIEHLRQIPKGINYATMIGQSALRTFVLGDERAYEHGAATEDEILTMVREVEAAIKAGAAGVSTSRFEHHLTRDDRRVPAAFATWDELGALIDVVGRLNQGVAMVLPSIEETHRDDWNEQMMKWVVACGRPVIWPGPHHVLAEARARGARAYSYWASKPFDSVVSFRTALSFDTLPGWTAVRRLPLDEQRRIFTDPERRAALVHEAMTNVSGSETGAQARNPEYDILQVLTDGFSYKTVGELARERNTTPVDVMIDLALETDFNQMFSQDIGTHARTTPADFADRVIRDGRNPWSVWGPSDSGAHLSQSLAYDNTTFFLGHWVRDEGLFTWEEAIKLLAFEPASLFGFTDRGLIREGLAADILVLDREGLSLEAPLAVNDLPAGALRLQRKGIGFKHTIVNGQVVLRDNEPTGASPGKVLPGSARPPL